MPDVPDGVPLDRELTLEGRGPAEWLVAGPGGGRSLHVYRIGPRDWLVSEVGRPTEGRGTDLRRPLGALDAPAWPAAMWKAISRALGPAQGSV